MLHTLRQGALSTVGRTFQWDDRVPNGCQSTVHLRTVACTWLCNTGDIEQAVLCQHMTTDPGTAKKIVWDTESLSTRSQRSERVPHLMSQSGPLRLLSKVYKKGFVDGQASIYIVYIDLHEHSVVLRGLAKGSARYKHNVVGADVAFRISASSDSPESSRSMGWQVSHSFEDCLDLQRERSCCFQQAKIVTCSR